MLNRTMIAAALLACASLVAPAQAAGPNAFEFVALGDMPYSVPGDYAEVDRLIAAINAAKPKMTAAADADHIG